jgi:tetratricopeptide (TPR) repeat protein/outer membrane biosynthesis protein TonB
MDLDIFAPEYKKEQKALEKAQEMLARASKAQAEKKPGAADLFTEALKFLDSRKELFVQHRTEFADCYLEISASLRQLDRPDMSFRSLEAAVETAPGHARAWAELGRTLLADGKFEAAAGYLDRALVISPQDADIWTAKGDAMRSLMEYGEARMCYAKALSLEPLNIDTYDLLLAIGPDDAEVLKGKGVALSLRNRHDEAQEIFKQALAAAPGNPAVLAEMGKDLARDNKREEAVSYFDRASQSDPSYKGAYTAKGRTLAEMGRCEESAKAYSQALAIDPLDREALAGSAETLMAQGKPAEALERIRRALEMSPRDSELHVRMGAALGALGKRSEAVKSYEEAITINPQDPRGWAGKGWNLASSGEKEQAAVYLEKAAALDPYNPIYAHWKGLALAALDRHEEAVSSFNSALDHDADFPDATYSKAVSLLALGRLDEAVRAFNRAGVLDPKNKAVWLGRARCSMRMEKYGEALEYIDKALAVDKDYADARALRAEAASLRDRAGLESCARQVLDFEQRNGRMPSREEAFRDCRVSFEQLDRVMAHIEGPDAIDLGLLSTPEKDELDALASGLVRRAQPGSPIRLSDAVKLLPGATVIRAKRVLGFIEAVKMSRPALEAPMDPRTEERSRAGLHLPQEERDLFSLVRRLNIGLYEARRVEQVLETLRTGAAPAAPPSVDEPVSAAAEVPESELEASPDMRLATEKRPRKPRRKAPPKEASPPGPVEPSDGETEEEEPDAQEPQVEETEKEIPAESPAAAGPKPPRKPRKRPAPAQAAPEAAAEAESSEPAEELDEEGMEDLSDSIKDIVSSIEKRETKKDDGAEKAEDRAKGRSGRTYCSVCHSIIATIHHGCGAHLCSRCVIDFNKDRRAEKNLCPKCLKPIETVPPAGGVKTGWRDSL